MECFQSSFSFFCLARLSSVAPTSTLVIGAPPAGAADPGPGAIEGDRVLGVPVPLGCATPPGCACARPKMADMIFPKMLILLLLASGSLEALPSNASSG